MTAPTAPRVLWSATVESGTFRLVDLGASAAGRPRFALEQQAQPDALGGIGWQTVGLPFADVLEKALADLLSAA